MLKRSMRRQNASVSEIAMLVQDLYEASNEVEAGERNMSHRRKGDVRAQNKRRNALWALLNELAASPDGRLALEALMHNSPNTDLRISIANVVMRWNGFSARDALEEIITTTGGHPTRPMTMSAALQAPHGAAKNAALSLLNLDRF